MLDLTFGEQVKIILSRKGMTIKELAEIIEERTGKKMSRQNLTQRLGRDNFQEQDMRMIADILGCPFQLSILADSEQVERASSIEDVVPTDKELAKLEKAKARKEKKQKPVPENTGAERDITIGELVDIHRELDELSARKEAEQKASEEAAREAERRAAEEAREAERRAAEEAARKAAQEEAERIAAEEAAAEEEARIAAEEAAAKEAELRAAEEAARIAGEEALREAAAENEEVDIEETEEAVYETEPILQEEKQIEVERDEEKEVKEEKKPRGWRAYFQRKNRKDTTAEEKEVSKKETEDVRKSTSSYEEVYESIEEMRASGDDEEDMERGEVNPYTGHEYETNSVRSHPKRIGYVQVYDRANHQWTDMTEWAFMGYQERKKALLGKDYEPPIYLE